MILPSVAIIGKPNVGKSSLFNRIIGRRKSIVEDQPGVTRDRLYHKAEWINKEFNLIDTGGIDIANEPFSKQIELQARIAIEEADVIIFLVDANQDLTTHEEYISKLLQHSKKPVILAVNKVDNPEKKDEIYGFYTLGFDNLIPVSVTHNINISILMNEVVKNLPEVHSMNDENSINFCLVGRPNVGKSSILNAITKDKRVIVSEIAGTTRDSVNINYKYKDVDYQIIDTAGIRKRKKVFDNIEKYSVLRSYRAIDDSDIVCIVLESDMLITDQDKKILQYASENYKGIVIVVNKWDLVEKDTHTMNNFQKMIQSEIPYASYASIIFVSALLNQKIDKLFNEIQTVHENYSRKLKTKDLNDLFIEWQHFFPSKRHAGGVLKIYYVTQVGVKPPTFTLFVNNKKYLSDNYTRYIKNKMYEYISLKGVNMKIIIRNHKGE